ncbi:hypothetical protein EDD86DRAFT_264731 [Gorgonomyces haynaldii]|nr:hypothetical protein EDD86DRAFT_264731 [Gorgonomyces haynaldii]
MKLIVALLCMLSVSGQKDPNYLPSNENVTLGLPQPPLVPLNGTEPIQVGYTLVNATSNSTVSKRDTSGSVYATLPYINYYRVDFSSIAMTGLYYSISFSGANSRVWILDSAVWNICKSNLGTCTIYRTWSFVVNYDSYSNSHVSGSYTAYGTASSYDTFGDTGIDWYYYIIIGFAAVAMIAVIAVACHGKYKKAQNAKIYNAQQQPINVSVNVADESPTIYGHHTTLYPQPVYGQPVYGQSQYGQSGYTPQQAFGKPHYGQPGYAHQQQLAYQQHFGERS